MTDQPKSVTRGTDTSKILSPPGQPGPQTRSRFRLNETPSSSANGITADRPTFGSADSNSSDSSSSTVSTRSDTSSDKRGREGSPNTPPSEYGEDDKGLDGQPCAANFGVPKLSIPSKSLDKEGSGDSREEKRPSTPLLGREWEDTESPEGVNASPMKEKLERNNLREEVQGSRRVAGISESWGKVHIEGDSSEETDSRREPPEQLDEEAGCGAGNKSQLEEELELLDVADPFAFGDVRVSDPLTSGELLLSEGINQHSTSTIPVTISLTPAWTPDETTELARSVLRAHSDAATSLDANKQSDCVEGSGCTPVGKAMPSQPETTLRKSSREKRLSPQAQDARTNRTAEENLNAEKAIAKKTRAEAARAEAARVEEKRVEEASDDDARWNETTATIAAGVGTGSAVKTASSKSSQKGRGGKPVTPKRKRVRQHSDRGKPKESTPPPPTFSNYHEPQFTGKDVHDSLFKLMKGNNKRKARLPSSPGVKLRSPPKTKPQSPPKAETEPPEYGYLYIYKSPLCPNHVKIGMTTGTPRERIKQWGKCNLPITRVKDYKSIPFLHCDLAEKLIMAELHNLRRIYSCGECRVSHRDHIDVEEDKRTTKIVNHGEWYKISEKEGLAVVQKWRGWFVSHRPFNVDGTLRPRWEAKLEPISANIAIMDTEEWVAEWLRPLEAKDLIPYFWRHCIKQVEDKWVNIQIFLKLLQVPFEKGVELLPFVGRAVFVYITACAIIEWIDAVCAIFFVIIIIPSWLWLSF
ncbi:hypothetical protein V496_07745 [Pseudogymnoascus sp. VKM F-4515 (FW-2607)]|nr:hypothetical protein V496_07745 [Pseudogymnoascus sp. VKM F-4515 (FW-2607)]KFY79998.1 hypothetical protein V498_08870 [Pseudogymnoascus sp. VKM F-4517 (FW-2822)]